MQWIPQSDELDVTNVNGQAQIDNALFNQADVLSMKFTGCTPSTVIGTAFVNLSLSIIPTSQSKATLPVTPRGSY